VKFRTRSQEVEAVQWTGTNDGALHELKPGVLIPSGSFRIQPGYWLVVSEDVVSEYDGYGWLHPDEFDMRYEPVPDLIRTVEEYEGLPDGTILEVVEFRDALDKEILGRVAHKRAGRLGIEGITGTHRIEGAPANGFVCSVVRLGGES